jgi:hypothetical protein
LFPPHTESLHQRLKSSMMTSSCLYILWDLVVLHCPMTWTWVSGRVKQFLRWETMLCPNLIRLVLTLEVLESKLLLATPHSKTINRCYYYRCILTIVCVVLLFLENDQSRINILWTYKFWTTDDDK